MVCKARLKIKSSSSLSQVFRCLGPEEWRRGRVAGGGGGGGGAKRRAAWIFTFICSPPFQGKRGGQKPRKLLVSKSSSARAHAEGHLNS